MDDYLKAQAVHGDVEALQDGATQREVAKLAGLTQPAVHAINTRLRSAQGDT